MDISGRHTFDFVVNFLKLRQKLLNAKRAESVAAFKGAEMQGHGERLEGMARKERRV